jgi:hypothetical protein
MADSEDRLQRLEAEIERRLLERFAGLRDEFDRLRLESDRRWAGFLSRFDQDFKGLVPSELIHHSVQAIVIPTSPRPRWTASFQRSPGWWSATMATSTAPATASFDSNPSARATGAIVRRPVECR